MDVIMDIIRNNIWILLWIKLDIIWLLYGHFDGYDNDVTWILYGILYEYYKGWYKGIIWILYGTFYGHYMALLWTLY